MASFSSLFWASFFMQDVQKLNPMEVGIRLLPQAATGLILSPLVGFWMHKIDNLLVIMVAALCQFGASVLLACVRQDSNYFVYVFPSLVLSTLSMDWVRNVGAVSPDSKLLFAASPSLTSFSNTYLTHSPSMIKLSVQQFYRPPYVSESHSVSASPPSFGHPLTHRPPTLGRTSPSILLMICKRHISTFSSQPWPSPRLLSCSPLSLIWANSVFHLPLPTRLFLRQTRD